MDFCNIKLVYHTKKTACFYQFPQSNLRQVCQEPYVLSDLQRDKQTENSTLYKSNKVKKVSDFFDHI